MRVPLWMHLLGRSIHRNPATWIKLANLETRAVADAIAAVTVDRPIYIAGLARAGTTVLLEQLAQHPSVATHRYIDYPPVLTPYWWNRWLALVPRAQEAATERAHGDGIEVTSASPEAFEEMLWMAFFPSLHAPERSSVFDRGCSHPDFERFYDEHIRKLLAVRGGSRYVAKGNYNLTRLAYLQRLYPGARFVIAVRDPVWHIASLMKQHKLFCAAEEAEPKALAHMQQVGHYEFGLDRRPVNVGNAALTERIRRCWASGAEVEGWALYWAALYRHVADQLDADPQLRAACLLVRYEELVGDPVRTLTRLYERTELVQTATTIAAQAASMRAPTYYQPTFSAAELDLIHDLTREVAAWYGY